MKPLKIQHKTVIIDNDGYTLSILKDYVPMNNAGVYHLQFVSEITGQTMQRHEYFLTKEEMLTLAKALTL